MGAAPQDYTVEQVVPDGNYKKIAVTGYDGLLSVSPANAAVSVGQQIKGWLNPQGKYGPYIKIAEERQNGSSGGNEGQIIGWAHTLAAFELAHELSHADVAARAEQILARQRSSARPASSPPPADQSTANGADSGAQPSGDDEIPF